MSETTDYFTAEITEIAENCLRTDEPALFAPRVGPRREVAIAANDESSAQFSLSFSASSAISAVK